MPQKKLHELYELTKPHAAPFAESSYGVIYEVKKIGCSDDEPSYALKTIQALNTVDKRGKLSTIDIEKTRDSMRTEITILTSIKNKLGDLKANHIIPILDYGLWPNESTKCGEPCFVMPYGESSLYIHVKNESFNVDIHQWCQYAEQLLTALHALSNIEDKEDLQSHRDIKPENIVLVDKNLYLIDFGIARTQNAGRTTRRGGGTIDWMAPEQAIPNRFERNPEDNKDYPCYHMGPSVDIYSTGHMLYWICTKEPLASQKKLANIFNEDDPSPTSVDQFEKVGGITAAELSRFAQTLLQHHTASQANTGKTFRPHAPDYALPNMKTIVESMTSLLQSMLVVKENDRITAPAAFQAIKAIQTRLSPKLESISIDAPSQIQSKQIYTLTVSMKGQGFEQDNSWWQLTINDAKVHGTYQAKQEADVWTWTISRQADDIEQTLMVRVCAFIGVDCEYKDHKISVLISPESLWEQGRYTEVLEKYPESKVWLDQIREQIKKGPHDRKTWLGIMDCVYTKLQSLDMLSTCVGFTALRASLQKQVEEDERPKIAEPEVPKPPKPEVPRNPEPEKAPQPAKGKNSSTSIIITIFLFSLTIVILVFLFNLWEKAYGPETTNQTVTASIDTDTKKQSQEPQKSKTYTLTVKTTPSNAQVRLVGADEPTYRDGIALAKGNYKVEVSASGYDTITKWVYITDNNVVEQITLKKTVTISDIVAKADEYSSEGEYAKAFPLYQQAADAGNANAQFSLGVFYENGLGVTQDYKKVVEWYTCAAKQGHAFAQYYLGRLYEEGRGVTKDINKAIEYYEAAAKQGNSYAKQRLAELQKPKTYGLTVNTTPSNARVRVMKIAPIYHDGIQLENGKTYTIIVDAKGYEDVTKEYTINGKDIVDHVTLKKPSIDPRLKQADDFFKNNKCDESLALYTQLAEEGNAEAQHSLGFFYGWGICTRLDLELCAYWYRKAAEQGHASAQLSLAQLYRDGVGVEQNSKEALKWYYKAAEQEYAPAQYQVGEIYQFYDNIVATNDKEAVKWYTKSAEQGHYTAQWYLANCYATGIGVKKDEKKAVEWYLKSANQGHASAQIDLGDCYLLGRGVTQNKALAIYWFQKAARDGIKEAQDKLRELGETW